MQTITYTNNNESVTVSRTFPYLLQNLEGTSAPPSTLLSQRGFQQDGVTYLGSLLEPRLVHFRVMIQDSSREGLLEKRAKLYRVFNPKSQKGVLTYQNDEETYRIEAVVYDGPHEVIGRGRQSATMQTFEIGLYCPRPAWECNAQKSMKLVGFIGGLTMPLVFPLELAKQGSKAEVDYQGTLDAPLLVEFRGPATMPKIVKEETGEYIEVNVDLQEDDKLFIDTTPSAINVYTQDGNGVKHSAFNYISPKSSYITLTKGSNTISFGASSGEPEVYLYWRDQYIGV